MKNLSLPKLFFCISCGLIMIGLPINVSAKSEQELNILNSSLKYELNGETLNLNNQSDSYYRTEQMKDMSPKEKILELKKDFNIEKKEVSPKTTEQTEEIKEEKVRVVIPEGSVEESHYEYRGASILTNGEEITIPEGLGRIHTYMGWQLITAPDSMQYKLREQAGMKFDNEGFGIIDGRYVVACTTTYGRVGDYIDVYQADGSIIPCIIGDIKSQGDAGCTIWGHQNGNCIIEFVVDYNTWYGSPMHSNPGSSSCHPEWNQNITKIVNGGSWFK